MAFRHLTNIIFVTLYYSSFGVYFMYACMILKIELNWIELNWIELNWIELNWIELNWIELHWIELNWIELYLWILFSNALLWKLEEVQFFIVLIKMYMLHTLLTIMVTIFDPKYLITSSLSFLWSHHYTSKHTAVNVMYLTTPKYLVTKYRCSVRCYILELLISYLQVTAKLVSCYPWKEKTSLHCYYQPGKKKWCMVQVHKVYAIVFFLFTVYM